MSMKARYGLTAAVVLIACGVYARSGAVWAGAQSLVDDFPTHRRYCSATARAVFDSCRGALEPDYWLAVANCANVSDDEERGECFDEAQASRREEGAVCRQQLTARQNVCDVLGEERYDPDFEPDMFETDFRRMAGNRYFPLQIGNQWEYRGGGEAVSVKVLDKTKLIDGVTCVVVNDRVSENGRLVEDTDDWFAQAKNGDVYYCGEQVKDFEWFEGDVPQEPELISIEGSFKSGRDSEKPGILFLGNPTRGKAYRQEFFLGTAEDVAEVLSTTYAFGRDAELDKLVPRRLAEMLCSGDCVVTKDYSPLEPDVFERKYYAPGIGMFLELKPGSGEVVQLVTCNFDARCNMLTAR